MNTFNRIAVIILLIFIVVFSIVAVVNKFINFFLWGKVSNWTIDLLSTVNPYIIAIIFILLVALCIFLLVLEFYTRKQK